MAKNPVFCDKSQKLRDMISLIGLVDGTPGSIERLSSSRIPQLLPGLKHSRKLHHDPGPIVRLGVLVFLLKTWQSFYSPRLLLPLGLETISTNRLCIDCHSPLELGLKFILRLAWIATIAAFSSPVI